MVTYTSIDSDSEKYKISALLIKGKYCMPSLSIKIKDGSIEYWDNIRFLYFNLLPHLKKEKINDEIYATIPIEDNKILLELFTEAIKLNFFGELLDEEKKDIGEILSKF